MEYPGGLTLTTLQHRRRDFRGYEDMFINGYHLQNGLEEGSGGEWVSSDGA